MVTLSVVAITMAVVVAGCAGSKPATAEVETPNAVAVSAPTTAPLTPAPVTPKPSPTAIPTAAPASTPVPTPTSTAPPQATPGPAAPALVAVPRLTKSMAGATKVTYFQIVGNSPVKLVRQILAESAKPCRSKVHDILACVTWKGAGSVRAATLRNPYTGSCTITSATVVTPTSTVHLPQWVGPAKVRPELVAWWKPVLGHFAWHEGQHIKISNAYADKLERRLDGASCSAFHGIIQRTARQMHAAQARFDAKDFSWQPLTAVPYDGPMY